MNRPTRYDQETCVTAGELRATGFEIPADVPDCAWTPRSGLRVEVVGVEAEPGKEAVVQLRLKGVLRWTTATVSFPAGVVRIYAIYDHPTDHPEKWVVRGWNVEAGKFEPVPDWTPILRDSLEEARAAVRDLVPDAVLLTTSDPDPNLAEVWA